MDILNIVRKENLHEAVLMIKVMNSRGNLSLSSCSSTTGPGILHLPTSLPLFYRAEKGCTEVLKNRQTSSTKKAVLSYWLCSYLNVPCTRSAPHISLPPSSQEWKIWQVIFCGDIKKAGWKPLSCVVFKEQSSIELKLYPILQYLADRWHKPNLLLREACWLASRWACMEKDI